MTIQENNRLMQAQLKRQAKISRNRFKALIERQSPQMKELAIQHLTRAQHFEKVANEMFLRNWKV